MLILIGVLVISGIAGGVYYLKFKKTETFEARLAKQNPVILPSISPKQNTKPTSDTKPQDDEILNWKTYTEKSKIFSIKYPNDDKWLGSGDYFYEYGNRKGIYSCAAFGNGPASGNGNFSEEQLKQAEESTAAFICYSSESLPDNIPTESESHLLYNERNLIKISNQDFKPFELNGYSGYKTSAGFTYFPSRTDDVIYLKSPRNGYVVIIGEGKDLKIFYKVLSTFRFLDSENAEGKSCGGFTGEKGASACPERYYCKYPEPVYPDDSGICVKK